MIQMMPSLSGPIFDGDPSDYERGRWLNTLANLPIFDRAASGSVERILASAHFRRHPRHERIYSEGEPASHAWFLIEGTARVFQSDGQGGRYTPKIFVAPTHFGDLASLARLNAYRSSIEALIPTVSARVPRELLLELLEEDHGLCLSWLFSVARQHAVTIDADRQSVFGGLFARIANLLLSYGEAFGVGEDRMTGIDHPLSYASLATDAGCTRRRAIAITQELSRSGLVKAAGGGWRIDQHRLKERLAPGRLSLAYSVLKPEGEPRS
jgi:CRP-like cAMP-binding protein